jgi:hypothetical protein
LPAAGKSLGAALPIIGGDGAGAQAQRNPTIPSAGKLAHIALVDTVHLGAIHPG